MPYNPDIHHRHTIRLREYDYSNEGLYFVTICTQDKRCLFGHIIDNAMVLNEVGKIIQQTLESLPERFDNIRIDNYVIMPNHIHAILVIMKQVEGCTVGQIVGTFKSLSYRRISDKYNEKGMGLGKLWQRNYYEHIIRNSGAYDKITDYILSNPERWAVDDMYIPPR